MFTGGMFIPLFIPSNDIKEGMMAGILVGAAFGYMYMVFMIERARRSLPLLLGLPLRPLALITAKYLSLYSMCLVTANFAGVFLRDARTLYLLNAEVLFLATVLMAAVAIFEHPVAPMIPLFLIAVFSRETRSSRPSRLTSFRSLPSLSPSHRSLPSLPLCSSRKTPLFNRIKHLETHAA